jgi:hypothetical protein
MKINPLFIAGLAFVAVGCGPKEETGVGLKPQLQLEGKTLDEKIAAVQNDKTIPPDYKETYIKSLRDQAAGGGGTPPAK